MDYLSIWNAKFGELLEQLDAVAVVGNTGDLALLRAGFAIAVAASKDGAWSFFYEHVYVPYAARILERDESFFLALDPESVPADSMDIVHRVRLAWRGLNDANRAVIWDYFVLLVRLSERIKSRS